MSVGGIAVRPSSAVSPAWTGVLSSIPPPFWTTSFVDGDAWGRTPDGLNTSSTDLMAAFATPRLGSSMYTMRHVIPAAKAEIAIGINTAVRNATAHETPPKMTVNNIPIEATRDAQADIHSRLFLRPGT